MADQEPKRVETIKMVDNAMRVLDILKEKSARLGVNDIAKSCQLNPSTVFRILKTLEMSGWVFRLNDGRYVIGEKVNFVTERNNFYLALREVASIVMSRYVKEYGRAMNLMVRDGMACVIIEQMRTASIIDYVPPVSSRLPFYACAGGKILLSELSASMLELIMESVEMIPFTPQTITNKDRFWCVLQEVKKKKYAFDQHESAENGSCVAVPVRDREGTIIAALSFSGFIGIKDTEELMKYVPVLDEASKLISRGLYKCW